MSAIAMSGATEFLVALTRWLRRVVYVLSGVILAAVSARAEAPVLSPEFWNYMVEFDDGSGNVFDPADFAAMSAISKKAQEELDRTAKQPHAPNEHSDGSAARMTEGQPQ